MTDDHLVIQPKPGPMPPRHEHSFRLSDTFTLTDPFGRTFWQGVVTEVTEYVEIATGRFLRSTTVTVDGEEISGPPSEIKITQYHSDRYYGDGLGDA